MSSEYENKIDYAFSTCSVRVKTHTHLENIERKFFAFTHIHTHTNANTIILKMEREGGQKGTIYNNKNNNNDASQHPSLQPTKHKGWKIYVYIQDDADSNVANIIHTVTLPQLSRFSHFTLYTSTHSRFFLCIHKYIHVTL